MMTVNDKEASKMNIKKIIAREGLIFVSSFLIAAIFFYFWLFHDKHAEAGFIIGGGILLYPILSFTVWAIKTLRK